jgi:hypothetical protein
VMSAPTTGTFPAAFDSVTVSMTVWPTVRVIGMVTPSK